MGTSEWPAGGLADARSALENMERLLERDFREQFRQINELIVKPDGVARNLIGEVYRRFEKAGLAIVAAKLVHLSKAEAEGFYAVHKARPFFNDLVKYMTSGPVVLQVLEGENAVAKNREIMGATDPKKAAPGTIRADLAESIEANTVHGSDSPENAAIEIAYFFAQTEIHPR